METNNQPSLDMEGLIDSYLATKAINQPANQPFS